MGKASFTPSFNAFRFYDDDGNENSSTPLAAEDTNVTLNVTAGNSLFHLRCRIDETGGAAGAAEDDYTLQYQTNGAGGWTTITGSTSVLQAEGSGSQLTDSGNTTDRATNGISNPVSGSFVTGGQDEVDAQVENRQLTADNFTEHVWALNLVSGDVTNATTLTFRASLNGGNPGMTSVSEPTITVLKLTAYTLNLEPTTYTISGADAAITADRIINLETTSYAITGADATFAQGLPINLESGSYAISGADQAYLKTSVINLATGSYAVTGADATFARGFPINLESGSYIISGADATLTSNASGGGTIYVFGCGANGAVSMGYEVATKHHQWRKKATS